MIDAGGKFPTCGWQSNAYWKSQPVIAQFPADWSKALVIVPVPCVQRIAKYHPTGSAIVHVDAAMVLVFIPNVRVPVLLLEYWHTDVPVPPATALVEPTTTDALFVVPPVRLRFAVDVRLIVTTAGRLGSVAWYAVDAAKVRVLCAPNENDGTEIDAQLDPLLTINPALPGRSVTQAV
jgi:hypothetical protein